MLASFNQTLERLYFFINHTPWHMPSLNGVPNFIIQYRICFLPSHLVNTPLWPTNNESKIWLIIYCILRQLCHCYNVYSTFLVSNATLTESPSLLWRVSIRLNNSVTTMVIANLFPVDASGQLAHTYIWWHNSDILSTLTSNSNIWRVNEGEQETSDEVIHSWNVTFFLIWVIRNAL